MAQKQARSALLEHLCGAKWGLSSPFERPSSSGSVNSGRSGLQAAAPLPDDDVQGRLLHQQLLAQLQVALRSGGVDIVQDDRLAEGAGVGVEVEAALAAGIEASLVPVEDDVTTRLRDKWLEHMAKDED